MNIRYSRFAGLFVICAVTAFFLTGCSRDETNRGVNTASSGNANANKAVTTTACVTGDDPKINADVKAQLTANPITKPLISSSLNFNSKGCVMHLEGWVLTWDNFKAVTDVVMTDKRVLGINVAKLHMSPYPVNPGACPPPLVPCNDICVEPDTCNMIIGSVVVPPGANVNVNANANVNTNTGSSNGKANGKPAP